MGGRSGNSNRNSVVTQTAYTGTDLETASAAIEAEEMAKTMGLDVKLTQRREADALGHYRYWTEAEGTAADISKLFAAMREYRDFLKANVYEDNQKSRERYMAYKNRINPDAKVKRATPVRKKSHSRYHI